MLDLASTIERVATDAISEFSDPPTNGIFFHGFSRAEMMLQAIKAGQFGRSSLTSIGADGKSKGVPLFNRIWFREGRSKLHPVLYGNGDPVAMKTMASERTGLPLMDAEIGPMMYRRENEWYSTGRIHLSDIEVVMVSTVHGSPKDVVEQLVSECDARGYPFNDGFWEH